MKLEAKVKAGTAAGAAIGLTTWLLITLIPQWHKGLPSAVADALPFALAWAGHTIAAYLAPHTARTVTRVGGR